ncbi:28S ribosomal protein S18b, mitochondrial isoform X1 [Trichosurus vulpecula]|uniref:28S ribosomal protein S18b, mitochondrial isoform X1 n=1 Tax=Trichosurus vulpecula TaxID=9337 RepID=UPI00186B3C71|nr:28S ribosomal protein S18b, mitochondrial isoform X1 [Trichosurus vulpecula]
MATSLLTLPLRRLSGLTPVRGVRWVQATPRTLCTKAPPEEESSIPVSLYQDAPWEYLETEGTTIRKVWQEEREKNTWLDMVPVRSGLTIDETTKVASHRSKPRGNKVAGNPCPICRDQKLHVDFRNVKLLEQFVCAHTGVIFHAPYTGVCMKQHKKLTEAILKARDHGFLSYHIPLVQPRDTDFSNSHGAVGRTPKAPALAAGTSWYSWYNWQQPPERELARLRRLYRDHLKEESGPPPDMMPIVPSQTKILTEEEESTNVH